MDYLIYNVNPFQLVALLRSRHGNSFIIIDYFKYKKNYKVTIKVLI